MNHNKHHTGQLLPSKVPDCPLFIPELLYKRSQALTALVKQASLFVPQQVDLWAELEGCQLAFDLYLSKFFAGDKNMERGFADVPIVDLYLWQQGRFACNVYVKKICNNNKRFIQASNLLQRSQKLDQELLDEVNQRVRCDDGHAGIRRYGMKAGDPVTNPTAFYCIPVPYIDEYLTDLLGYINSGTDGGINKAFTALMQFIFIHPYSDGNGRVARLLFLHMMRKAGHPVLLAQVLMLYLKNINRIEYHEAVYHYQHGNINELSDFYVKAMRWAQQSVNVLHQLWQDYQQRLQKHPLVQAPMTQQVVIRQAKSQRSHLDEEFFQLFAIKNEHYIYVNNPLLTCLHQFDHYLRSELRLCKQNYQPKRPH